MNPLLRHPARLARSVLRSQTDERLTELASTGSDAAFEAIVDRYRAPLLRHCRRVVGHGDADEAVQDALINAHHALARGDRVRHLGPWLHAIARNASLTIVRARAARSELPHGGGELHELQDHAVDHCDQLKDALEVVKSLPLRQRDAIVMRELEGLSYEEIGARLGATNGAVRQLLGRARRTMRVVKRSGLAGP